MGTPASASTIDFVNSPRRRLTRSQRREQLLDTAESLFASVGYDATTMEEIARAAGVTRAIVYAHFDNKDSVLRAGVERARAELGARLQALRASATELSVEELIFRGGDIFFRLLEDAPSRWALMFAPSLAVSESTARALARMRRGTIMQIAEIAVLARTDASRDQIEASAYAISGIGEQLGHWWLSRPDLARDVVVRTYTDLIMHGAVTVARN